MDRFTDEDLIARFRAASDPPQNNPHLNELFRRYHEKVAWWCWKHTGNREQAADLAQDVFLRVFQKLDSFQGSSRFSTWLYTVVRNHCFNDMKSRASEPLQTLDASEIGLADESPDSLALLEQEADSTMVRKLLREVLDETERSVMYLHYAEEMPLDSVTRILGLRNASGAKAFIVSARRKLQKATERLKRQGMRET